MLPLTVYIKREDDLEGLLRAMAQQEREGRILLGEAEGTVDYEDLNRRIDRGLDVCHECGEFCGTEEGS